MLLGSNLQFPNKYLSMPRVGLVGYAVALPRDHPIQDSGLVQIAGPTPKSPFHLAHKSPPHELLYFVEGLVRADEGKLVPMHHTSDIQARVEKTASRGSACHKPHLLKF